MFSKSKDLNCSNLYSTTTQYFNTGFIPKYTIDYLRYEQKLLPQLTSNLCYPNYLNQELNNYCYSSCGNNCLINNNNSNNNCNCNCKQNFNKNVINSISSHNFKLNDLYPINLTPLPTYGVKEIPNSSYCTKYVQPP